MLHAFIDDNLHVLGCKMKLHSMPFRKAALKPMGRYSISGMRVLEIVGGARLHLHRIQLPTC